jgi:hypothetical protein
MHYNSHRMQLKLLKRTSLETSTRKYLVDEWCWSVKVA